MQKSGYICRTVCIAVLILVMTVSLACFVSAEKIIVALDPGHGGYDGGTNAGYRNEKEYNMIIAEYMYEYLSKNDNFEVVLTRADDVYMKFLPRVMTAMEKNADVIISLHCNSNNASYVNGSMAYCSVIEEFDAAPLAEKLLDAISGAVSIKRGYSRWMVLSFRREGGVEMLMAPMALPSQSKMGAARQRTPASCSSSSMA